MSEDKGFRVTCEDLETGVVETEVLPPDKYVVICTGRMYVAHEQHYPTTGTAVITVMRRKSDD